MWTIVLWILGALVALILGYLLVMVVLTLVYGGKPVEGVKVTAEAPAFCSVGDTFEITVTVRNLLERERKLGNIDFKSGYLKGFAVESVTPTPADSSKSVGYYLYEMRQVIPASGTLEVRFNCRAVNEGDFEGEICVHVDSAHLRWTNIVLRTVVRA